MEFYFELLSNSSQDQLIDIWESLSSHHSMVVCFTGDYAMFLLPEHLWLLAQWSICRNITDWTVGVVYKWISVSYKMHRRSCALFSDRALAWYVQGTGLHAWHGGLGKVCRLIILSGWREVVISFSISDESKLQKGHVTSSCEALIRQALMFKCRFVTEFTNQVRRHTFV